MKTSHLMGAAAQPFAHLLGGLGRGKAGAARAEDDKDDKDAARAEGDEDDKDAEGDEDDKDASRAEGGEDDKDAEGDDDDKDAKKAKKAKKAKAEDDDETCAEEDSDDDDVSAAAAAGRKAERARCRRIFSSAAAGARPDVAAQLAFATNLTSAEAIGVLTAAAGGHSPKATGSRLHDRMSRVRLPDIAEDAPSAEKPSGSAAAAKAIAAAAAKARGVKPA